MTKGRTLESRRGEARDYYTKVPISWRYNRTDCWRDAWLHDSSISGLALLVEQGAPRVGEEIELIRRGHGQRVFCCVVRTQLCQGGPIMVACRLLVPDARQAWLRPSPKGEKARRRPIQRTAVVRAA